jgi:hypothetical protein
MRLFCVAVFSNSPIVYHVEIFKHINNVYQCVNQMAQHC